jgi:hypothetical protein
MSASCLEFRQAIGIQKEIPILHNQKFDAGTMTPEHVESPARHVRGYPRRLSPRFLSVITETIVQAYDF